MALILTSFQLQAAIDIPTSFYMDQPPLVDGYFFSLRTDEKNFGAIKRHITGSAWSGRIPQYDLISYQNGLEGIAKVGHTGNNVVVFDVTDREDYPLGSIEANFEYSSYYPAFQIFSAENELLAKGQISYTGYTITLLDALDDHVLALVTSNPGFSWTWTVEIKDPQGISKIDSCLLMHFFALSLEGSLCYKISQ